MAGYAAYVKVDGFNILPVLSFSMAASTFAGQNVGAGKYDRVKKGMWVSTGMGVGYTIISGILLLIFCAAGHWSIFWQTRCSPVWNLCYEVFLSVLLACLVSYMLWQEQSGEQERHFRQWLYSLYPYVYAELSGFGRYFESTTNCLML